MPLACTGCVKPDRSFAKFRAKARCHTAVAAACMYSNSEVVEIKRVVQGLNLKTIGTSQTRVSYLKGPPKSWQLATTAVQQLCARAN